MKSFREGIQCEPVLWDASIGILLVGAQQESFCEWRSWNSPAQRQRNTSAVPTPCHTNAKTIPTQCQCTANGGNPSL
eukprot:4722631-Pyramimonas_sp.AAC.1